MGETEGEEKERKEKRKASKRESVDTVFVGDVGSCTQLHTFLMMSFMTSLHWQTGRRKNKGDCWGKWERAGGEEAGGANKRETVK